MESFTVKMEIEKSKNRKISCVDRTTELCNDTFRKNLLEL